MGHHSNIGLGRGASLSGLEIDRLIATTISRKEGYSVLQVQITGGIASAHDEIPRDGLHGFANQLSRDFDNLGVKIYMCVVVCKDCQCLLGGKPDSDVL